jgi:hypothetical protein
VGGGLNDFPTGQLLGQQVTVSASITLLDLGVVGQAATGASGVLALYSNSGGAPATLMAQTASTAISAGANLIPVTNAISVSAGTYWIVGEYSATASICVDTSTSNLIDFVSVAYPTVPATFGTPRTVTTADINYYLYGILQ